LAAATKSKLGITQALDKLYEFERAPVTADHYQRGRHFAGVFAGEHVAATEFVIGALFVSKGARTCDVIVGLILGNLLAVLSWALICAPIAVQTRLTLYWYLRRIGGPALMVIYSILNAIMFGILAGAHITVSASAVRLAFGIPAQIGWLPTDIRFVFVVLGIGAVVVILAILGFKKLAEFSEVCSPWMFLMFIAGALAMIPAILASFPELKSITSFYDFWRLADARIWPGPQPGQTDSLGFLHIASFAWIANLAMHLGLSDMALFRYAKNASYGFYSAFGMYLGHYLAWICAGIMGAGAATLIGQPLTGLDAGAVAFQALGLAGAITVVAAGWTTANPTIYRVGLALQVATPNWPRWLVTLIAGAAITVIACSPFVFTKLLDFVGIYGLLLMPIGAIVFVEHWVFPRIGLTQYWTARKGRIMNWPALLAWLLTLIMAVALWQMHILHLFFLIIPVWFAAAFLYIIFAALGGARDKLPELQEQPVCVQEATPISTPVAKTNAVIHFAGLVAIASLIAIFALSIWVARADINVYNARLAQFKTACVYLTIVYFIFSVAWIVLKDKGSPASHA
jgi:NCS1 family nucleobase:cation symporter-1